MLSCWMMDPTERPTFSQLVVSLSCILDQLAGYFDLNAEHHEHHPAECEPQQKDHPAESKTSMRIVLFLPRTKAFNPVVLVPSLCLLSSLYLPQECTQMKHGIVSLSQLVHHRKKPTRRDTSALQCLSRSSGIINADDETTGVYSNCNDCYTIMYCNHMGRVLCFV